MILRHALPYAMALFILLTSALPVVTGCDTSGSSEADDEAVVGTLPGSVGPAGGTLSGALGTALEGVVLEVPAGAVSVVTRFEVRPAADTEPLPSDAVAVGPQLQLIAKPGALEAAVQLTVPVFAEGVGLGGGDELSVKVWRRAGPDWSLVEPVSSGLVTATVELEEPGVLGAGVKQEPSDGACRGVGCSRTTTDAACGFGSEAPCFRQILSGALPPILGTRLAYVEEGAVTELRYLTGRAAGTDVAARLVSVDLATGLATKGAEWSLSGDEATRDRGIVANQDGVFAATHGGVAWLGAEAAGVETSEVPGLAQAVVRTRDGQLAWLTLWSDGISARVRDSGAWGARFDLGFGAGVAGRLVAVGDPTTDGALWLGLGRSLANIGLDGKPAAGGTMTIDEPALALAVAPDGGLAYLDAGLLVTLVDPTTRTKTVLRRLGRCTRLVADSSSGFWALPYGDTAVARIATSGAFQVIEPSADAASQPRPHHLVAAGPDSAVLLDRDAGAVWQASARDAAE